MLIRPVIVVIIALTITLTTALGMILSIVTLPNRLTNNGRQLLSNLVFARFIKRDAIVLIMG